MGSLQEVPGQLAISDVVEVSLGSGFLPKTPSFPPLLPAPFYHLPLHPCLPTEVPPQASAPMPALPSGNEMNQRV